MAQIDTTMAETARQSAIDQVSSSSRAPDGPIRRPSERLSIPFALRLPLAFSIAGLSGFVLGAFHGGTEQGLRFRAENSHRFPKTQTGWYLYHKSKNYHMALGGIKEGIKMGFKQAIWVSIFFGMEESIDRGRAGLARRWRHFRSPSGADDVSTTPAGHRDFVSSAMAGLGTAGLFSAWNRFPLPTAARLARMGVKVGLAFGILQDTLSLLRGRRLGYVEFIKSHTFWRTDDVEPDSRRSSQT